MPDEADTEEREYKVEGNLARKPRYREPTPQARRSTSADLIIQVVEHPVAAAAVGVAVGVLIGAVIGLARRR